MSMARLALLIRYIVLHLQNFILGYLLGIKFNDGENRRAGGDQFHLCAICIEGCTAAKVVSTMN